MLALHHALRLGRGVVPETVRAARAAAAAAAVLPGGVPSRLSSSASVAAVRQPVGASDVQAVGDVKFDRAYWEQQKVLIANRGEIARRIADTVRAMGAQVVTMGTEADQDNHIPEGHEFSILPGEPKGVFTNLDTILAVAEKHGATAIHPGYGYRSEAHEFPQLCREKGIVFIGPSPESMKMLGDKEEGKKLAESLGIPTIPGSGIVKTLDEAIAYYEEHGKGRKFLVKGINTGGGKGIREFGSVEELGSAFVEAQSEALNTSGSDEVLLELYLPRVRHIEVQGFGDQQGNVIEMSDRDCSVQRRKQKALETAPASQLPQSARDKMFEYTVRLGEAAEYATAFTCEFLVDMETDEVYFLETNTRLQVEHTVTEETTGKNVVEMQVRTAHGQSLPAQGITQEGITSSGVAIQARVTTERMRTRGKPSEDPENKTMLTPSTGYIEYVELPSGPMTRIDTNQLNAGTEVGEDFDPLLTKVTVRGRDRKHATQLLIEQLKRFKIAGVNTNIPFLINVLETKEFQEGEVGTTFIDQQPEVAFKTRPEAITGASLMRYWAKALWHMESHQKDPKVPPHQIPNVNPFAKPVSPNIVMPTPPRRDIGTAQGLYRVFLKYGPEGLRDAILMSPWSHIVLTDGRDGGQSLFATLQRVFETARLMGYSQEMAGALLVELGGGATDDISLRRNLENWLHKYQAAREFNNIAVIQSLVRAGNATGYETQPGNLPPEYLRVAKEAGLNQARIFDSLNYGRALINTSAQAMEVGLFTQVDITAKAGVSGHYDVDYYLGIAQELFQNGSVHGIGIKDAGNNWTREEAEMVLPPLVELAKGYGCFVSYHTHNNRALGQGNAEVAANAGVHTIHVTSESMTAAATQPPAHALLSHVYRTQEVQPYTYRGITIQPPSLPGLAAYDEMAGLYRDLNAGIEAAPKGFSPIGYDLPGGQGVNLENQLKALGNTPVEIARIKKTYSKAALLMGDPPLVTPSSKVCGDLAEFVYKLIEEKYGHFSEAYLKEFIDQCLANPTDNPLVEKAHLMPVGVQGYFCGNLGTPPLGFHPIRDEIVARLKAKNPDLVIYGENPSDSLPLVDWEQAERDLDDEYGFVLKEAGFKVNRAFAVHDRMFQGKITAEVAEQLEMYGPELARLSPHVPAPLWHSVPDFGQQVSVDTPEGTLNFVLDSFTGKPDDKGLRYLRGTINGRTAIVPFKDPTSTAGAYTVASGPNDIGAPVRGKIISVGFESGEEVKKGDILFIISVMKMETPVEAPRDGKVTLLAPLGTSVRDDELIAEYMPEESSAKSQSTKVAEDHSDDADEESMPAFAS